MPFDVMRCPRARKNADSSLFCLRLAYVFAVCATNPTPKQTNKTAIQPISAPALLIADFGMIPAIPDRTVNNNQQLASNCWIIFSDGGDDLMTEQQRLNIKDEGALALLQTRRSGSAKAMTAPGPDSAQLNTILTVASRVPDHGKLTPWRFIVFEGDARSRFGEKLAELFSEAQPEAIPELVEAERRRFLRAPVVVAVVSRVQAHPKIPEWEQVLSAGASCMALCMAAHAMGFAAGWVTEWVAYDARVRPLLGLGEGERVAGFVYLGSPGKPLEDRPRPALDSIVTRWAG